MPPRRRLSASGRNPAFGEPALQGQLTLQHRVLRGRAPSWPVGEAHVVRPWVKRLGVVGLTQIASSRASSRRCASSGPPTGRQTSPSRGGISRCRWPRRSRTLEGLAFRRVEGLRGALWSGIFVVDGRGVALMVLGPRFFQRVVKRVAPDRKPLPTAMTDSISAQQRPEMLCAKQFGPGFRVGRAWARICRTRFPRVLAQRDLAVDGLPVALLGLQDVLAVPVDIDADVNRRRVQCRSDVGRILKSDVRFARLPRGVDRPFERSPMLDHCLREILDLSIKTKVKPNPSAFGLHLGPDLSICRLPLSSWSPRTHSPARPHMMCAVSNGRTCRELAQPAPP